MPNFLENMKLVSLATVDQQEAVSLVELLLTNQVEVYNKQASIAKTDGVSGNKVRTRKDRRRSGRSSTTRKRTEAKKGNATQRLEQLRTSKVAQERRRKELLAYQSQQGNKSFKQETDVPSLKKRSATSEASKRSKEKAAGVAINSALRPVLLALIDFNPIYSSRGRANHLGKLLTVKRASRALAVESASAPDTSEEFIGTLDYTTAYGQLMVSYNEFLDSLDASNIELLDEAMSAFSIESDTLGETSNTEVLFTLVQEYSRAIVLATPRLEEASTRELEVGSKLLMFNKSQTSNLRWSLAPVERTQFDSRTGNSMSDFDSIWTYLMSGDEEMNLKIGLNVLSKEMVLSFNKTLNALTESDDLDIKDIFQAKYTRRSRNSTIEPSSRGTNADNPYGTRNLGGITYVVNPRRRSKSYYYPFEKSELLPDSKKKREQNSAPDEVRALYKLTDPTADDGPYAAISDHYSEVKEKIERLISVSTLEQKITDDDGEEIDKSFSVIALEKVLSDIISKMLTDSTSGSNQRAAKLFALWMYKACTNQSSFGWLLIYLAFLREKLAGEVTEDASSADSAYGVSLSDFVLHSSRLGRYIGAPKTTRKVTKTFTIPTSKTTLTPGMEESSTTATNDVVRKVTTTKDRDDDTDADEDIGLAATYDMSFEELCSKCASHLAGKVNDESSGGGGPAAVLPPGFTDVTTCSLEDIEDLLTNIPTQESSIAHELLRLIISFDYILQEQGASSFTDDNETSYSKISKMSMSVLSIGISCLAVSLLLGEKVRVKGTIDRSTKGSSSSSSSGRGSGLKGSRAKLGASMGSESLDYAFLYLDDASSIQSTVDEYLSTETEEAHSILDSTSEPLSRVISALQDEHDFLSKFAGSLSDYFSNVAQEYEDIVDALKYDVDDTDVEETLLSRIKTGLPISNDMIKMLMSYTKVYDSSGETYEGIRTTDKLLSKTNLKFLRSTLKDSDFCVPDKLKYIVVGLPSGMLDSVKSQPVNIEDSTRSMVSPSLESFIVSLEKIDLTKPEQEFKEKEFSFSRNLFYSRSDEASDENVVYFNTIDDGFELSEQEESEVSAGITEEQIYNAKVDTALKMYSDILLDLDFSEDAYTNGKEQQTLLLTSSISMHRLGDVDKTAQAFLSGSNIAFDTEQREISGFVFFNEGSNSLDMRMLQGLDPTAYSVFSYLNRYGSFASASAKKESLRYGTKFERIVCIPFDPDDFDVEPQAVGSDATNINMANKRMKEAEEEVGIGLETSQGVELSTYRVSVKLTSSGGDE